MGINKKIIIMKQKLLFLFFVWVGLMSAQQVTIDLSTGKNDDGTLMNAQRQMWLMESLY